MMVVGMKSIFYPMPVKRSELSGRRSSPLRARLANKKACGYYLPMSNSYEPGAMPCD